MGGTGHPVVSNKSLPELLLFHRHILLNPELSKPNILYWYNIVFGIGHFISQVHDVNRHGV